MILNRLLKAKPPITSTEPRWCSKLGIARYKNWPTIFQKTEKILEVFQNQYFLNNKNHPLAVLTEEASDSFLPVYQV
jgi:hypothetical protein